MSEIELTIGMPVYRDLGGPWATVDSLIHHHHVLPQNGMEILVIDNAPDSAEGKELARWAKLVGIRYEPYGDCEGPAGAKDEVFRRARGRVVACLDSHVLLRPGAVTALRRHFAGRNAEKHARDLVSGPQVFDHGQIATHLDRQWGGGMLGRWALAWYGPGNRLIYPRELPGNRMEWLDVRACKPIETPPEFIEISAAGWAGHERRLIDAGWYHVGHRRASRAPVPVPSFGMGAFACRRDQWQWFRARETATIEGFGGEEVMLHDAHWLAGGRVIGLPQFQWVHRYLHLEREKPYRREWYDRVRTYLLWGQRLQYEQAWWRGVLHREFVASGLLEEQLWRRVTADPVGNVRASSADPRSPAKRGQPTRVPAMEVIARDNPIVPLAEPIRNDPTRPHAPRIVAEWAGRCQSVVDLSPHHLNAVVIAVSGARRLHTWSTGSEAAFGPLHQAVPNQDCLKQFNLDCGPGAALDQVRPPAAECLVLELGERCPNLRAFLQAHAPDVGRYIVILGSDRVGRRHSGQAYRFAIDIRVWWETARADWHIVEATDRDWGVCVFGRDRGEMPVDQQWPWDPGYGPGTELHTLLDSLSCRPDPNCPCFWRMGVMNRRGVAGCRETRAEIEGWIREAAEKWSWVAKLPVAAKLAIVAGTSAISDPVAWVVGEAIRRSEAGPRGQQTS